jgi:hypothetical protein
MPNLKSVSGPVVCDVCLGIGRQRNGCREIPIRIGGKNYRPIAHLEYHRCRKCGVHRGEFHHENCENEVCPVCAKKMKDCECKWG